MQGMRRSTRGGRPRAAISALAALAALLAACAPRGERLEVEDPPVPAADTTPEIPAQAAGPTSRPEVRQDTILIEGMPEPVTLRLYRTPPGFPLPFSTYVPADMEAETVSSGEGDAVRFVAAFGGRRTEAAHLLVTVHPEGVTEQAARQTLRAALGGAAAAPPGEHRYPWALAEFSGGAGADVAHGALGRHQGQFFQVVVRYPAEFGDGFAPRAAAVLGEWRWERGNGPLGS